MKDALLTVIAEAKKNEAPIAPGIKSKNLTLDQSGSTQSGKVTVDFQDVSQALKFFQDLGGSTTPPQEKPAAPDQDQTPRRRNGCIPCLVRKARQAHA